MLRVKVSPINDRGQQILKSNTDKFGLSKVQGKILRRVGDKYTITEFNENPFYIMITVKPEFEKYVSKDIIYSKTLISVEKILNENNGSIRDVDIEVYNG